MRRGLVDAGERESLRFGDAGAWRVIVTLDGAAAGYPLVADPGPTRSAGLANLTLHTAAGRTRRRAGLAAELRDRLGVADAPAVPLTVSVVVCTHRRHESLATLLRAVARLDPAPAEVIVVDSAPGPHDCRALVASHGHRYVRVDAAGQNRARAAGLAAARCDVVAFTDDDCAPPPGWLATVDRRFADPTVGAVTGPAFARRLDTPGRALRERAIPFISELTDRRFDWSVVAPASSGATGAGANLLARRTLLLALGDAFPPELDGGTPTRSGGDLHVLYRLLASGWRVTRDTGAWTTHDHPSDLAAVRETAVRYGAGFSSFLTKALIESRELGVVRAWSWLVQRVVLGALMGERIDTAVRVAYLAGGLRGPFAWAAALRGLEPGERARPSDPGAFRDHAWGPATPPDAAEGVEVIATPDAAERNRRARASTARVLVFTGADAGAPGLAAAHAAAHGAAGGPAVVAGVVRSGRHGGRLAAQLAAWRIEDAAALTRSAHPATVGDVPWDNLSLPRDAFLALGGFDAALGGRMGAADLAFRAAARGLAVAVAPAAEAVTSLPRTAAELAAGALADGAALARLVRRHPEAAALAPAGWRAGGGRMVAVRVLAIGRVRRAALLAARALEAGRLRTGWISVVRLAELGAFDEGWRRAGGGRPRVPVLRLDAGEAGPVVVPGPVAPVVSVEADRQRLLRVRPPHWRWTGAIADEVTRALPGDAWRRAAASRLRGSPGDPGWAGPSPVAAAPSAVCDAEVHRQPDGTPFASWADAVVRDSQAEVVLLLAAGTTAARGWETGVLVAFEGPHVQLVSGPGRAPGEIERPLVLRSRALLAHRAAVLGDAPQYVAVRRAAALDAGGFAGAGAPAAIEAASMHLADRLLDRGGVVGHLEVGGLWPHGTLRPERTRGAWRMWRARGALLAREGRLLREGLLPQVALLPAAVSPGRHPSRRSWLGCTAALVWGALGDRRSG